MLPERNCSSQTTLLTELLVERIVMRFYRFCRNARTKLDKVYQIFQFGITTVVRVKLTQCLTLLLSFTALSKYFFSYIRHLYIWQGRRGSRRKLYSFQFSQFMLLDFSNYALSFAPRLLHTQPKGGTFAAVDTFCTISQ